MKAEEILNKYESFNYSEDGCDETHYYKDNVLLAMEEYAQQQVKNNVSLDVVSKSFCPECKSKNVRRYDYAECNECGNEWH